LLLRNGLLHWLVLVVWLMMLCQLNGLVAILFLNWHLVIIIFHSTKDNIGSIIRWQGCKSFISSASLNLLRCFKVSFLLSIHLRFLLIWLRNRISSIYSLSICHLYWLVYIFGLCHLDWFILLLNSTLYWLIFVLSSFKCDRNISILICLWIIWLLFVL